MQFALDDAVLAYDYVKTEAAQPPLLFLHGALGIRGQFASLRQSFAERSQIALDFAAHGASDTASQSMNCERLARDVLALLDALHIDQADIVGHSMGGYVGLMLAHFAPGRVRSVVSLGTKFYWSLDAIDKAIAGLDAESLRRHSPRYYEALAASHTASGIDKTLRLTQSLIGDFRRWQLTEEMVRAAGVPVLLCAGDRDDLVPAAEIVKLFDSLDPRHSAMAILPNTPHPLHHLPLDCFGQAVRRFWQQAFAQPA